MPLHLLISVHFEVLMCRDHLRILSPILVCLRYSLKMTGTEQHRFKLVWVEDEFRSFFKQIRIVCLAGNRSSDSGLCKVSVLHSITSKIILVNFLGVLGFWGTDAELRRRDHNPDRILSLYNLGFEIDERIDERFQELKQSRRLPQEALPVLVEGIASTWNRSYFNDWVMGHGAVETVASSIGRRLKGEPPTSLDLLVRRLVAGLAPLADSYPLPHFRRD